MTDRDALVAKLREIHELSCSDEGYHGNSSTTLLDIADALSRETAVLVVGRLDTTIANFLRRCDVTLVEEQGKPSPDNALIALLCDAVMMTREYLDYVQRNTLKVERETAGTCATWQPIETAPKDGRELLLTDGATYTRVGNWARRRECWSIDVLPPVRAPKYWASMPQRDMPLPASPAEETP